MLESVNRPPANAHFVLDGNVGWVALLRHSGEEIDIVNSARVSFGKMRKEFNEQDKKLLKFLIEEEHFAPLEHETMTFLVHCPLYVRGQWHRHRTGCLTSDTIITFNKPANWKKGIHTSIKRWNGEPYTLDYLYKQWNKNEHSRDVLKNQFIRVYDEKTKKFSASHIEDVIFSGEKDVYEITLESGKKLKLTDNHPLLTKNGWVAMGEALGLGVTNHNLAFISNDVEILVNGTHDYCQSYDWMKQERDNNYSVSEIAEHAGCSYYKVRYWLKKHHLQFNPLNNLYGMNGKPPWNKGKTGYKINRVVSEKHRQMLRELHSGENSNFWKGGTSSERAKIGEWTTRQAPKVHEKYNYTCQVCGERGGKLHAHHKVPVYQNKNLAYDFDNLITVCEQCHRKIHNNYSGVVRNNTKRLVGKYEKVVSVKYIGKEKTYDLTIAGDNHNFVANGIVVHNSYNEISRRYTEVDMELYTPEKYRSQSTDNKQASNENDILLVSGDCEKLMREANAKAFETYNKLLELGVCREQARGILPQNMMTTFYYTVNLRNVLHFLSLRMDNHAQWEIRQYAIEMHKILKEIYPNVIEAFDQGKIK